MTQILDTCNTKCYEDPQGKLVSEKEMWHDMDSLENNQTWDLVPRLTKKNVLKWWWVYWTKFTFHGVFKNHKAHLVNKCFSRQEGIGYTKAFSPVSKMNLVWLILSLATSFRWEIHQMDVKSTFLHGDLSKEIYIENPLGFMTNSNIFYKLN